MTVVVVVVVDHGSVRVRSGVVIVRVVVLLVVTESGGRGRVLEDRLAYVVAGVGAAIAAAVAVVMVVVRRQRLLIGLGRSSGRVGRLAVVVVGHLLLVRHLLLVL